MYQIDVDTVSTTRPASTSLGPTTGYFTDGNAATGVSATIVPAEFLNSVMLELMNTITGAGLTLSKASFSQLYTAIQTLVQGSSTNYAADTGVANAYVATYSPTVAAPADGMVRAFKVKTTNTGASTFALDGSGTTYPIYGMGGVALQGGELLATGIAVVRYNSTLAGWVLLGCGGAPLQVAAGTASKHAVNLGQFSASIAANGYQKLPSGLIVQWGVATSSSAGLATLTLPITFPTARLATFAQYVYSGTGTSTTSPTANISSSSTTSVLYAVVNSTSGAVSGGQVFFFAFGY